MKRWLIPSLLIWVSALLGQQMTGEELIKKVNRTLNVASSHAKMKMTIVTTSGDTRTFIFESWSKERGEKSLIRYQQPRRIKGQAVLMLNNGNDIWVYFPRTQRVRKLATHAKKQRMQGSDFSYEDMGGGDEFINDFIATRLSDEKMTGYDCYTVELIRKEGKDVSYSRLIMWVMKEKFVPIVIDYYDEDDPTLWVKRLVQSDIRVIDDISTGTKVVMHSILKNTQTGLELLDMEYNIPLDDKIFTERNLKK